jgi:cytochrome c553
MKFKILLTAVMVLVGLMVGSRVSNLVSGAHTVVQAQETQERKMPDVIQLSTTSKLGSVTFSHTNHVTKNYNVAGTGQIACTECHHTAQPASEVAKKPPLQTAWPKDRTDTLTAETFKDPKSSAVVTCRSCHAKTGEKPKVWPEIPQIKYEGGTAMITLNNQTAFHRNCAGCHDAAAKERPTIKAPKTAQCMLCHKK